VRQRGVVLVGLLAVMGGTFPASALAAPGAPAHCAQQVLDKPAHGLAALRALGDRLPLAAARSHRSPAAVANELRQDASAWLDVVGLAAAVEPDVVTVSGAGLTAPTSTVPDDQAFALHSRPGSDHVLYLDVDGMVLSHSGWNDDFNGGADLTFAPYDTDGSPGSFSTAERQAVIAIWQRVSEDYAPFDLDVTTQDPGQAAITRTDASDTRFGTRALVTSTSLACGGCAGIGYLGVFDDTSAHDYYQPALAFSSAAGGSPKLLGDIVAHEVGHNFGLHHDGTATAAYSAGQGSWAPIMGAATLRPISQWSKGEYAGANNTEDDLAIIASHGAPLPVDDHGDSAATATPLTGPAAGIIGGPGDTDWFSFTTTGGTASVVAAPVAVGADLDLKVDLLDSTGAVLATADPASSTSYTDPPSGLGGALSQTIPAGTYYVRLDGVGAADPLTNGYTDYGSLGRYTLDVSAPTANAPLTAAPAPVPVLVTTPGLPQATRGRQYAAQLAGSGGLAPYTWRVIAGRLPAGLSLSSTGRISGTPTTVGAPGVAIAATDPAGRTAHRIYALRVNPQPGITTSSLPSGRRGSTYGTRLAAAGGTTALAWRLYAGTLPSGLRLTSTGVLLGVPTARTTRYLTLQVTDARGALSRRTFTLVIS
jgi:hypothetical protein